jgi:hypothetical protein
MISAIIKVAIRMNNFYRQLFCDWPKLWSSIKKDLKKVGYYLFEACIKNLEFLLVNFGRILAIENLPEKRLNFSTFNFNSLFGYIQPAN